MNEIKSFEINKIYHITLDTNNFKDNAYLLNYKDFKKDDLICIHLIDREQSIESNLITFFKNLTINNMYCKISNSIYYIKYDNSNKIFVKEWSV